MASTVQLVDCLYIPVKLHCIFSLSDVYPCRPLIYHVILLRIKFSFKFSLALLDVVFHLHPIVYIVSSPLPSLCCFRNDSNFTAVKYIYINLLPSIYCNMIITAAKISVLCLSLWAKLSVCFLISTSLSMFNLLHNVRLLY